MANINSLEMCGALFSDPRISIKKSFFSKKAVYNNTQSTIKFLKKEYTTEVGMRIEKVLAIAADRLERDLKESEQFQETGLGNYLLEGGVSDDKQFAVFRLYRYDRLRYEPVTKINFYEGSCAEKIAQLF